jgi:hypothetical protein
MAKNDVQGVASVANRLGDASIELARYRSITQWKPALSDFIIWHGWWRRWYGVINGVLEDRVSIITDGLPCLVFTLSEQERTSSTIMTPIAKIRSSRGGEWHVLQNNVWYF